MSMSAASLMTCVVHGPTVLRPSLVINNARGLLSFLTRRARGHVRVARRAGRTHRRRSAVCTVLQYSPPNEAIVSMASYAKTQAHALTTRTRNWGGGAQQSAEAAPGGGGAGQAGGPGRQRSPAWQPDSVLPNVLDGSMDLWRQHKRGNSLPLAGCRKRRRRSTGARDWRAPGCLGKRRVVEDTLVTVWRLAADCTKKNKTNVNPPVCGGRLA